MFDWLFERLLRDPEVPVIGKRTKERLEIRTPVLGAARSGKSSLIAACAGWEFRENSIPETKCIDRIDVQCESMEAWWIFFDTVGGDESIMYNTCQVVVVVFDLSSVDSFLAAEKHLENLKRDRSGVRKTVLAGTKKDLTEERQVSQLEITTLCQKHSVKLFFEVSAKTKEGVAAMLDAIIRSPVAVTSSNASIPKKGED